MPRPIRGRPTITIIALAAFVVLLTAFVLIEQRVDQPLLPLHIVTDRARGGAYASILLAGGALFGVFIFLTYYLQQNLQAVAVDHRRRVSADDGADRLHVDLRRRPGSSPGPDPSR